MATVTTSRPRRLRARRLQREEVARPLRRRADLSGASVGTARGRCALAGLSRPGPLAVPDNARMETLADDDGEVHIQRVHIVASAILCQPAVHHLGEAHNCSSSEMETRARGSAVPGRAVPADQQRFPLPLAQNPFDVLPAEPLRGVFSLSQPLTRCSHRRELARPELWVANVLAQTFPGGTPDQSRLPVVLREQLVQEVVDGAHPPTWFAGLPTQGCRAPRTRSTTRSPPQAGRRSGAGKLYVRKGPRRRS